MTNSREVSNFVKEKLEEYWLTEPPDVRKLKAGGVQGAYYHISTAIIYSESETREMVDYLWYVKKLIEKDELDLNAAKATVCTFIDLKQDKWTRWYGFEDLPPIMKKVVLGLQSAETKGEFLDILETFQIFIGKFNFWLDNLIPWMTVASVVDWMLEDK
jgi:hypothetical protein